MYRWIFISASRRERRQNVESYWELDQKHSGEILEDAKDLTKKREKLKYFQSNPVRSTKPLVNSEAFYRNYVHMKDDPKTLDRKTLTLTCIYKFARHEWVGISGAWDYLKPM